VLFPGYSLARARVNGELYNVEFATFEAVKNPQVAAQ